MKAPVGGTPSRMSMSSRVNETDGPASDPGPGSRADTAPGLCAIEDVRLSCDVESKEGKLTATSSAFGTKAPTASDARRSAQPWPS